MTGGYAELTCQFWTSAPSFDACIQHAFSLPVAIERCCGINANHAENCQLTNSDLETSGIATWLNHRRQVRVEWILHEKSRRQILYRDFIEKASKCYIDALQHDKADIFGLVGVYAKLSSTRALSSKPVAHCAEDVARKTQNTYLEPDKSFVELRQMAIDGTIDLLQGFSDACHDKFEEMPTQF